MQFLKCLFLRENIVAPETSAQVPDISQVRYVACVLDKESQNSLLHAIQSWTEIPKEFVGRCHHLTVLPPGRFQQEDFDAIVPQLGQKVPLAVTAWAQDDAGIAVVVRPLGHLHILNDIPHITVAHNKEVGAVYSNKLLANRTLWQHPRTSLNLTSELTCVLTNEQLMPPMKNPALPIVSF